MCMCIAFYCEIKAYFPKAQMGFDSFRELFRFIYTLDWNQESRKSFFLPVQ